MVETKLGRRYIKEVMLVSGLKENVLSVGQMMEHGYFLIFEGNKVDIYDDCTFSNLIVKVPMKGDINYYFFEAATRNTNSNESQCVSICNHLA